jgi:26S proteasome regulatory subunit N1
MGLGLAYCGSHREDIIPYILPHVSDEAVTIEVSSLAALSLGFIFVGSKNGDVSTTMLQTLLEKYEEGDQGLDEKWAKFFVLGLALLYLGGILVSSFLLPPSNIFDVGAQEESDATIEFLKAVDHPISKTAQVLVEACAYAGTGNVLKIQTMLHHCDDHIGTSMEGGKEDNEEKADDTFQAFAVLAISLIAMGEEVGAEMALRQFNHLVSQSLTLFLFILKAQSSDALW